MFYGWRENQFRANQEEHEVNFTLEIHETQQTLIPNLDPPLTDLLRTVTNSGIEPKAVRKSTQYRA